MQVDAYRANYIAAFINMFEVQDMSEYLQYGQSDVKMFNDVEFRDALPSTMNAWPSDKNPRNRYVFSSVYILLSQDLNIIER